MCVKLIVWCIHCLWVGVVCAASCTLCPGWSVFCSVNPSEVHYFLLCVMCDKGKLWYFLPAWFFWNRSKLMRENTSEEVRWWMLWGVRWGEETEHTEKAVIHNKNCGMLFKKPRGKKTNYVPSTMENSARVPRKTSTVLKAMGGGGLIKVELISCSCLLHFVWGYLINKNYSWNYF